MEKKYVLSERLKLPQETISDAPLTQIRARRSVCIENHRGIVEYSESEVKIAVRRGMVTVHGSGLTIARMTRRVLEICGSIRALELE